MSKRLTQIKDSPVKGHVADAFAEIMVEIHTREQGVVQITFDYETFEDLTLRLAPLYQPEIQKPWTRPRLLPHVTFILGAIFALVVGHLV